LQFDPTAKNVCEVESSHITLEESLPLQPAVATWPLRLMLGKCLKISLWLSTRRFWIMTN